jgi:TolA-binding protein
MTDVKRALATARILLATEPLAGASERVRRAVLARAESKRPRRARPLVLAMAVALTTSAAALAVVEAPHLGKMLALWRHPSSSAAPSAPAHPARQTRPPAQPAASPLRSAQPEMRPPSVASVNPIPELPRSPATGAAERANATPAHDSPPSLAEEVAAYREAEALVGESPGLAIARLNAFRHRYPASPLAEEASLKLIQALLALGRQDDARRQARHFIVQFPGSAKRAELEALASPGDEQ